MALSGLRYRNDRSASGTNESAADSILTIIGLRSWNEDLNQEDDLRRQFQVAKLPIVHSNEEGCDI
jgi:hypothetical protein